MFFIIQVVVILVIITLYINHIKPDIWMTIWGYTTRLYKFIKEFLYCFFIELSNELFVKERKTDIDDDYDLYGGPTFEDAFEDAMDDLDDMDNSMEDAMEDNYVPSRKKKTVDFKECSYCGNHYYGESCFNCAYGQPLISGRRTIVTKQLTKNRSSIKDKIYRTKNRKKKTIEERVKELKEKVGILKNARDISPDIEFEIDMELMSTEMTLSEMLKKKESILNRIAKGTWIKGTNDTGPR